MYTLSDPLLIALNYTVLGYDVLVTFADLDASLVDSVYEAAVQGFGIGGGALLVLASWFVIINKKTPMFVMNQVALMLMIIRSSLYLGYLLGPLNSYAYSGTGLFYAWWSAYNVLVAVDVFYIFLIASIQACLVYQIYVVFKADKVRNIGRVLTFLATALALVIVALYIYSTTINLRATKTLFNGSYTDYDSWVTYVPFLLYTVSLNVISVVLFVKLVLAVRMRRKLGLVQFDSFHILLIMTTQTCLVPSAMTLINYKGPFATTTAYANLSVVITVCNLPLSSLWASSANNTSAPNLCHNSVLSRNSTRESQDTLAQSVGMPRKFAYADSESEKTTNDNAQVFSLAADNESIDRIIDRLEQGQRVEHYGFQHDI